MSIQRRRFLRAAAGGTALGVAGCAARETDPPNGAAGGTAATPGARLGDGELILATTTSTWDTGLLEALHPVFETRYGVRVKAVPRGTGAALRTARDGDADVVLVHARPAEDSFLQAGHGINRRDVMFNDFIIVGPPADPAGIGGTDGAAEAFAGIARAEAVFLSRGDDSGTHQKERAIWATAGVEPGGQWYREIGKGMGDTLVQASQTGAYTLADRGTFRAMHDQVDLVVHVQGPLEGGPAVLRNPYGVIAVNPATHPSANYEAAMAYIGFLTGPDGQRRIEQFQVDDEPLFVPTALSTSPGFDQYVPEGY